MKAPVYTSMFILFFLVFQARSIAQVTQDKSSQVIGTWVFNFDTSIGSMDEKAKNHYVKMGVERQEKVKRAYQNRIITFGPDGDFAQELSDGRTVKGTWQINKNKLIEITSPNGSTIAFKIKELNAGVLIISRVKTDNNKMNMLMSDWYLTRG